MNLFYCGLSSLSAILPLMLVCCGDSNDGDSKICENARENMKKQCEGYEDCLPCKCVIEGNDWIWTTNPFPSDVCRESECIPPVPCEGEALESFRTCLENEDTCKPYVYPKFGVIVCGNPTFPDCIPP